ncbi:MAG TPA: DUF4411 family protein [Candidatus Saccharimonadales bacterium]|nr:DUF4411 family protein [Candidatus Saccharimonadales bacterium]
MSQQTDIFHQPDEPKYCFDTSVFLNFLIISDSEPYGMDVMASGWEYIQQKMASGKIIAPKAVYDELKKREDTVPGLKDWLKQHSNAFLPVDTPLITAAKPIVLKYDVYATDKGDYGDLMVMSFAKSRNLTVVTSEVRKDQHKQLHPKIPNVCDEFDVQCRSVIQFFRDEGLNF